MTAQSDEIQDLARDLANYADVYLSADVDQQRLSVVASLHRVALYLEDQGVSAASLLPLIRPAMALADRENNAVDQMFCERREGRPRKAIGDHMRTALLAALADLWLDLVRDEPETQAIKLARAAREMRGQWFGTINGPKLKKAREAISEAPADDMLRDFHRGFAKILARFAEATAKVGKTRSFGLIVRYVNEHPVSYRLGIQKTPNVIGTDRV